MLKVENLTKSYYKGFWKKEVSITPVNQVSFEMEKGDILGLVGESGCGKSTLAKCLAGLLQLDSGKVFFEGIRISGLGFTQMLPFRKKIQIVFQHPDTALNPRKSIQESLLEPYQIHRISGKKEALAAIKENIGFYGLTEEILDRYPHQVSGGQIQRVALARAMSLEPELLILDEPTSMLDVSVQAQIIQLLRKTRSEKGVSMLLISHDLHLVRAFCANVLIMEKGRIAESGTCEEVFTNPVHPYSRKLANTMKF